MINSEFAGLDNIPEIFDFSCKELEFCFLEGVFELSINF